MKWIELLRNGDYALLQSESDTQYAVVSGYDPTQPEGQQWAHGTHFTYFQNNPKKILYLQSAYDCFMEKVNADFIPRCRLEELATLFKDGLMIEIQLLNTLMSVVKCQMKRNLSLVLKKIRQ